MFGIFKFLGDLLGYVMLFFLELTKNYGVAIILLILFIKVMMIPMDINSRKNMARNTKFSKKEAALKKKYEKDRVKFETERNKLYEKEGISPFGGCFSLLLPLFIVIALFSAVSTPLTSTFHFPADTVNQAQQVVKENPEIDKLSDSRYPQIEVFNAYVQKPEYFPMFSEEQADTMKKYQDSFSWFGINLFDSPKSEPFSSMLWVVPLLCFITQVIATFLMGKAQGMQAKANGGCMTAFPYSTALISAWFAYSAPVAVGIYWVVSTVFGIVQSLIFNKLYSVENINAKEEAARIALRLEQENSVQRV